MRSGTLRIAFEECLLFLERLAGERGCYEERGEYSEEDAMDLQRLKAGVHEETHTQQKKYNAYKATYDPKTKKYKNNRGNPKHLINHDQRPEEIEAEKAAEKAVKEFEAQNKAQ